MVYMDATALLLAFAPAKVLVLFVSSVLTRGLVVSLLLRQRPVWRVADDNLSCALNPLRSISAFMNRFP